MKKFTLLMIFLVAVCSGSAVLAKNGQFAAQYSNPSAKSTGVAPQMQADAEDEEIDTLGEYVRATDIPDTIFVNAVLDEDATLPVDRLASLGIEVVDENDPFYTLYVPLCKLDSLDNIGEFESYGIDEELETDNTFSQQTMGVNTMQSPTQAVAEGLPQAYTGKGVIVGVYDGGIDFNHNNFRDPQTHKSRILLTSIYGKKPTPAIMATGDDIDRLTTDRTWESHGTHVASTAAGSYMGNYIDGLGTVSHSGLKGVAHEADLILCGNSDKFSDAKEINALMRMDSIATARNEPLVVNLSIGGNGGFFDGKEEMCKFFDKFTDHGNKPGRIVCIAAGNEGRDNFTLHKELNAANNHTIRTFLPLSTFQGISVFMPKVQILCSDTTHVTFEIEEYDANYKLLWTSGESLMSKCISSKNDPAHNNRYCKTFNFADWQHKNKARAGEHWAIKISSKSDCKVRVFTYTYDEKTKSFKKADMKSEGQPGFTDGDPTSSINHLTLTNSVICVGNWNATNKYYGWMRKERTDARYKTVGDIAESSSWVDADDNGLQRPDIAAPGCDILSGYNCYDTTTWNLSTDQPVKKNNVCGKAQESYLPGHVSIIGDMSGTSMACPNTAGVIALMLQADPTLTVNKIRSIFRETADNDTYTAAKSVRFGAGKLNALKAMKMVLKDKAAGINDIDAEDEFENDSQAKKVLIDGRIYILKGNQRYDLSGRLVL